jgi:DNA-binding transcriptional LysR family regulator
VVGGAHSTELRLPTYDSLYAWELEKDGHEVKVPVQGQLVFNSSTQILKVALAGFGLTYLPEDIVQAHLAEGRLTRVLEDWCSAFPVRPCAQLPPQSDAS